MSEELRQKGYLSSTGVVAGDQLGDYEGFNLGNSTLNQLSSAGIVPALDFGDRGSLKPDGLVVRRDGDTPEVKLVVEFKDLGELDNDRALDAVLSKVANEYCKVLRCSLAVVSDGATVRWILVDPTTGGWRPITREDGYPLDAQVDLSSDAGRGEIALALGRIQTELNQETAHLEPPETVDPTRLADQTWQAIWLASGENPERCLASFIEVLLFKFLSDLGTLTTDSAGRSTTFEHVASLPANEGLKYYFDVVRPEIERLFPPGEDSTTVIGGLVLEPKNGDHGRLFAEIIRNFAKGERLRRIDPEFKSRIFERFLKKSISQKNWGQYFTPRNVIKAMVEMSGIDRMAPGEVVADPFCGVGGFLLEPLVHKRQFDFRGSQERSLFYRGYDRDPKTIMLAKANMLIHLSEVLERDPENSPRELSPILNATFRAVDTSITGSLSLAPRDEWDLVLTNPPYVVTGTTTQRKMISEDPRLSTYYSVPGSGIENLCLQEVIAGLKPGKRALVIVPDGLLTRHSEEALKRHLLKQSFLEAVISLPKDTFYSTPKKTYILVFRKKLNPEEVQTAPVLAYLVNEVGETRDAKRFAIEDNHLPDAVAAFKRFQADPSLFQGTPPTEDLEDPRAKVFDIGRFSPEEHWLVDRWWTEAERQELGDIDHIEAISPEDLVARLRLVSTGLRDLANLISNADPVGGVTSFKTVSLGDKELFRLSIGKRVLKKDLFGREDGPIPLYSANVTEPFGHVETGNLSDFSHPSILWGIDGDFHLAVKEPDIPFATTDHCGRIEILNDELDASFCRAAIALARAHGFDRTLRPSIKRIEELEIEVPIDAEEHFDTEAQAALASVYDLVVESLKDAALQLEALASLQPEVMFGADDD